MNTTMKAILAAASLAAAAIAVSCSGRAGEAAMTESEAMAARYGAEDARAALSHAEGSMQRERSILQIRAREQALKEQGDSAEAKAYAASADSVFMQAGLFR